MHVCLFGLLVCLLFFLGCSHKQETHKCNKCVCLFVCSFVYLFVCSFLHLFCFFRPCLLSLDLSHNNLCDLIDVINKLSSLPKLRNLVLLGNPLAVSIKILIETDTFEFLFDFETGKTWQEFYWNS